MPDGEHLKSIKSGLLVICGTLSLLLGAVGIFFPVLPTTPFLLLSAACYARSSVRLHSWLLNNRIFGSYIRDYQEGRGVSLRHKIAALVLLWLSIGYAAGFAVSRTWLRILLLGIAAGVTIHLCKLKTRKGDY
ncbi:MAG TPA: YbaN family protein [bacterium]|jgi:uncharacterized membrane protein YbaN (DUF454 family)|nr:YbaN family protein [bacterium]HOC88689.1 YbaN family protein [bacterium]HOZ21262.1 YbaN family protein [bacterium]